MEKLIESVKTEQITPSNSLKGSEILSFPREETKSEVQQKENSTIKVSQIDGLDRSPSYGMSGRSTPNLARKNRAEPSASRRGSSLHIDRSPMQRTSPIREEVFCSNRYSNIVSAVEHPLAKKSNNNGARGFPTTTKYPRRDGDHCQHSQRNQTITGLELDFDRPVGIHQEHNRLQPRASIPREFEITRPVHQPAKNGRGRNFLLTVPYDTWQNYKLNETLHKIAQYAVGQEELNKNGSHQIQIFLISQYMATVRNIQKLFKILWVELIALENVQMCIDYCTKEDTRVPEGIKIEFGNRPRQREQDQFWVKFLNSANVEEGMAMLERERPFDFIRYRSKYESALRNKIGHPTRADYTTGWRISHKMFQYVNAMGQLEMRTLIFLGASGIGKTNFALSHFQNPLHVTGRQKLGLLGPDKYPYDGIVIDDIMLADWKVADVQKIIDCNVEGEIAVKYGTSHIQKNIPRIICCTNINFVVKPSWPAEKLEAIYRRVVVYNFSNNVLYENNKDKTTKANPVKKYEFQVNY